MKLNSAQDFQNEQFTQTIMNSLLTALNDLGLLIRQYRSNLLQYPVNNANIALDRLDNAYKVLVHELKALVDLSSQDSTTLTLTWTPQPCAQLLAYSRSAERMQTGCILRAADSPDTTLWLIRPRFPLILLSDQRMAVIRSYGWTSFRYLLCATRAPSRGTRGPPGLRGMRFDVYLRDSTTRRLEGRLPCSRGCSGHLGTLYPSNTVPVDATTIDELQVSPP